MPISNSTLRILTTGAAALALAASTTLPTAVAAPLEEIVVTADFHGTSELEFAESVSIVSADTIDARAAQHLEELIGAVPNLGFAGGTGRARFFQIRGIGERSEFADPVNPSVGVLVDHIDLSGAGSAATLLDVEQVEVLRGPQGTRYGANALAGLIKIKTFDPTDRLYSKFSATGGSYGAREATAVISGPLGATLGGRLAVGQFENDGYYNNAFLGRDDVNYAEETTVRAKLHWAPSANSETVIALSRIDVENGYDAFTFDNSRTTLSDEPGMDAQQTTAVSIDSRLALGAVDLQLIGAASQSDMVYGYDEDWTYVGYAPPSVGYSSTDYYYRDLNTGSLEARLLSNDGDAADWVVGAYLLSSDEDLRREYTFLPADFFSTYDFTSFALFAERDFALTQALRLTGGLRWERRKTTYDDSEGIAFEPEYDMWGGQLALEYQTDSSALWYASISRGYKAGGFNTDGSLDADLREFDPESLVEFEVGVKTRLANDRLRLRGAAFYDDRRDQQVKSSIVRERAGGSTEFIDFLGNAAEGTNMGLELEADYLVNDAVVLFAGVGLLDTEFDRFINEFGEDLSGREQAHAPSWTLNAGIDVERSGWFGRLAVDGRDDFFFSDRHGVRSDAYVLVNARVGYRAERWSVSLWGRNLNDEDVFIRGFGSFGNDPRKGYAVEPYKQLGEPRVAGLTFTFEP